MTAATPVRRPFGDAFVRYGKAHDEVVCVTNDLTASCEADDFRAAFPDRCYSLGMAEQNLVGVLAGLAREGLVPFFTTFSVFATRRPYEQIALSVAYPRLPVRLIGFLPGLVTPGGVTHQATDDVALMRGLPNMTVLDLGDATEVETVWSLFDEIPGPVFCRALRGEVPRLFDTPIELGRARPLEDGDDALVLSSGVCTELAMAAVAALREAGVDVGHMHVSTLKPFDDPAVTERIARVRRVVTVENHLTRGGLGSAVAELIADEGLDARLERVGVRDTFTHGGSRPYLFEYYGLAAPDVVDAVARVVGRELPVDRDALRDPTVAPALRKAVAEGL